jgi:hypothetical protein
MALYSLPLKPFVGLLVVCEEDSITHRRVAQCSPSRYALITPHVTADQLQHKISSVEAAMFEDQQK